MRKILAAFLLSSLFIAPINANADSWFSGFFNSPQLEVSENVVVADNDNQTVHVKLTAQPNSYYMIAINSSSNIFTKGTDEAALAEGSLLMYSGRMDRNGFFEGDMPIPKEMNGRLYIQAMASGNKFSLFKRKIFGRSNNFSRVIVVMLIKEGSGDGVKGEKGDKGDTGPMGPMGPQGPAGEQGPQGEIGPMGPQGLTGPAGLNGADGAAGPKGETGATGPMGPQGPAGLNGSDGATGPMGPQGPQGETGPQGPQGLTGLKGDTGASGPQGIQGETGPIGPQGIQGEKGDKGDTGATGAQGETGAAGPQGPQGEIGQRGAAGPIGPRGLTGLDGAQGPQGLTGPQGETGAAGPQGEAGAQGIQGEKGDKGDTGAVGATGPQGAQGVAGLTPVKQCAAGWIDLGPTCMENNFNSSGTIEQAINECYSMGARVCGHQDLAFACGNRTNLGLTFPDNTWLHTGAVSLRDLNIQNSTYVAYEVYRRSGTRCFGPASVNPTDAVVSYDLLGTVRNYACCMDASFEYQ